MLLLEKADLCLESAAKGQNNVAGQKVECTALLKIKENGIHVISL